MFNLSYQTLLNNYFNKIIPVFRSQRIFFFPRKTFRSEKLKFPSKQLTVYFTYLGKYPLIKAAISGLSSATTAASTRAPATNAVTTNAPVTTRATTNSPATTAATTNGPATTAPMSQVCYRGDGICKCFRNWIYRGQYFRTPLF
jgi:hypothetical protein